MKKTEIRVTIDSVEKQQRAIEILERYGEKIWDDKDAMSFWDDYNSLRVNYKEWYISTPLTWQTEITLDELETLLKSEK